MDRKFRLTKYACYVAYVGQAITICLSAILFATFREMYGISYTLLGLLPFINFFSQLFIDLVFSFFSKYFNIPLVIKFSPVFLAVGLAVYALGPMFFPSRAYVFIAVGTVIYSIAAGLAEVFISPTVAALPTENPEREMSLLHSVYAWGAVAVTVLSTLFVKLFGGENWHILSLLWCAVPAASLILFLLGRMPEMANGVSSEKGNEKSIIKGIIPFLACIFFGSAAENTMTQWISDYAETALGYPKLLGDLIGMVLFMVLLGLGRTLYGKYGKNIENVIVFSFAGSVVCYAVISLCSVKAFSLVACVFCGIFASMLWPGTLIWMEKKFPSCGVAVYALLAAGGDIGGSVAPQLVGALTDRFGGGSISEKAATFFGTGSEEAALRLAVLSVIVFPLIGFVISVFLRKKYSGQNNQ